MSIKAMNWAWEQALPPNSKLILMALADAADEDGQCWPRVRVIAEKCCTSERTVQRVLKELESRSLLRVETRYRRDGGQSSNGYFLNIASPRQIGTHPDDNLTLGGEACDTQQVTRMSPPSDSALSPHEPPHRTTKESPLLPVKGDELVWPRFLSERERKNLAGMLNGVSDEVSQLLLDELAGVLGTGSIKTSAERWFRAMVQRFRRGLFVPTAGVSITKNRQQQTKSPSHSVASDSPASSEVKRREIERMNKILGRTEAQGISASAAREVVEASPHDRLAAI